MKINKNVLVIVMVALVSAGIAGTFAYFTAIRTVQQSQFEVGTLDLSVDSNGNVLEPFVLENLGENGNMSGSKTWTIRNTGSLPGIVRVSLANLQNTENGCNDQEKAVEPGCENDNVGELGDLINLTVSVDGQQMFSTTIGPNDESALGNLWDAMQNQVILDPNETTDITFAWSLNENAYGNEIQSDAVNFDVNFRLVQQISGPTPTNP
ncbi:MAG: hypothetical protein KatS3mg091_004 [Patescibacteria group bacterium]|nr:MAG: hypothetical protein KatS3mg090_0334 [Patescibacteria group bacterium]GIW63202.1 MAG: hypothetical protein KatS3mg091_004 [Patescibacteria group bacterium]